MWLGLAYRLVGSNRLVSHQVHGHFRLQRVHILAAEVVAQLVNLEGEKVNHKIHFSHFFTLFPDWVEQTSFTGLVSLS